MIPIGTSENSPAFQRLDPIKETQVPTGLLNLCRFHDIGKALAVCGVLSSSFVISATLTAILFH